MFNNIDFDKLFQTTHFKFPPYNVRKVDDKTYVIEMAVAGFGKKDIEVILDGDKLTVAGKSHSDDSENCLYKGISSRSFKHDFSLKSNIELQSTSMLNGILKIQLEALAFSKNPVKKIEITDSDSTDDDLVL